MMKLVSIPGLLASMLALSACGGGLGPYQPGGADVIATAADTGRDSGVLADGGAAIAYDPDGCQGWLIDDGIEGYSGRRFDPLTGLPVCNSLYPPGTVLGNYQSQSPGLRDWTPRSNGQTYTTIPGDQLVRSYRDVSGGEPVNSGN